MNKKQTLGGFLYNNTVFKNPTHMDMNKRRNYKIRGSETDTFLNLYTRAIKWSWNPANETPARYYLLEKSQDIAPMIVDIDIKEQSKKVKPLYTEKHVLRLTKIFQKVLKANLTTKCSLHCFVLEKPPYMKDNHCKNGFHLHFPYVWMSAGERLRINTLVSEAIKDTKISHLKPDNSIINGNWLMYGSMKSKESGAYKVSYIIEEKRTHVECKHSVDELVWILSIIPKKDQNTIALMPTKEVVETSKPLTTPQDHEKTSIKDLKYYIDHLKNTHSENYQSWKAVGYALFNETRGKESGRQLWHTFSKGYPSKYNYFECESFWRRLDLNKNNYSVGTLKYYLKQGGVGYHKPRERYLVKANYVKTTCDNDESEQSDIDTDSDNDINEIEKYNDMMFG